MDWLKAPELQGIAALIAIVQVVVAVVRSVRSAPPAQPVGQPHAHPPSSASTLRFVSSAIGVVVFFIVGWILYSSLWALFALAMGFPASMVLSTLFFALGAFPALGVLLTTSPLVGGFFGGGIPLGTLALFYASSHAHMLTIATPLAWFGVFVLFGGLIGAMTGPAALRMVQMLGLDVFPSRAMEPRR